jgi:CBS domain-containing protein
MRDFRKLATTSVARINNILQPTADTDIDLSSSAMEILTDFRTARPLMIEQSTSVQVAKELMKRTHVRLKLVIDAQEHFKGVISLTDLVSIKVMKAKESTGLGIDELTVADVMTQKDALHAIDIRQFRQAKIGDILTTMQTFGDQHVLVVDNEANCICGIVSSSDIARSLHVPVYINERANSFSDIYHAVRG